MSTNKKVQKAILVDLIKPKVLKHQAKDRLDELDELVNTHGGIEVVRVWQRRMQTHAKTYIGSGKIIELGEEAKENGVDIIIINDQLKSRQIFELDEQLREYGVKIWDRLDLILKIFAKHAKTTEAKLEIELASIRHMGPRIFGMGMELSRQGGGTGTRGLGETNIERMKRHLKEKERSVKKKLSKYTQDRELIRKGRKRRGLKTVSLVGYTNAGKTTLLNSLTGRKEYAADALFATLDTRVGELYLPKTYKTALISDTIGFIKDLPPELLNAFASTLSEAIDADYLLHVVDVSSPLIFEHIDVVEEILERLGIEKTPRLLVLNKMDKISDSLKEKTTKALVDKEHIWISAENKLGLEELIDRIEEEVKSKW
jgi:GTPase